MEVNTPINPYISYRFNRIVDEYDNYNFLSDEFPFVTGETKAKLIKLSKTCLKESFKDINIKKITIK